MNLHCPDRLLNATGALSEHASHLIMSPDGRWVAGRSILNHGAVSTTQQLGWTALILHHTLSCEQRVCNVAADWILMRRCYFVIPTACVCALRVRQRLCNTMLFRNDSTSAPLLNTCFFVFFFLWLRTPNAFSVSCVFLATICSRSAGFSFTGSGGGGVFLWLACVGLIHHQSFADVCDC